MDDLRWPEVRRRQGLEPGGLRLQDQHLFMLRAMATVLAPGDRQRLSELQVALLEAGQTSPAAARAAAAELARWLDQRGWTTTPVSRDQAAAVRRAIARSGADGNLADYAAAEQAFLGIESLSYYLGDADRLQGALDALFSAVSSDSDYEPGQVRSAMQQLVRELE